MDKRFLTFLMLSFVVLSANMMIMRWLQPPQPQQQKAAEPEEKTADQKAADELAAQEVAAADKAGGEKPADADAAPQQPAAPKPMVPEQRYTLGSLDPATGYRELVTLLNTGAAVERIELTSPRYLDQEDRSGYLGQLDLTMPPDNRSGTLVRVVGPGTPAAAAGLKVNDVITAINGQQVVGPIEFYEVLKTTEPGQTFTLAIEREAGGEKPAPQELTGTLRRRPMEIVRPESLDPLSFLLTLESVDGKKIAKDAKELAGLDMLSGNWQALPQADESEIAFQYDATEFGLSIVKKFRLAKVAPADVEDPSAPAYHLDFSVEVRNTGTTARKVAWRLDGPNGLPLEGAWYATKMSPNWRGGAGMRDVAVGFMVDGRRRTGLVSATTIAEEANPTPWQDEPLEYIGVDAQYFAVALLPAPDHAADYGRAIPIRVGEAPEDRTKLNRTNVSFRLTSKVATIEPAAASTEDYKIFAGPKRPALLSQYGLGNLVYYGWFGFVAAPMLDVLHFFYRIIPNYGIAIIMLTVLVRSLMFPLSRRQALGAQKMQELQPEIKRIQEKYKGNIEARTKAQQELFKKHNYNPLAGCLPVFLQLPIFLGLYRSLAVDVELRGAPLLSESIRWCSNLAAPDMLWNWQNVMPAFVAGPSGWLGPYFNLLPCLTIGLFIWQQKMFMSPPTDEQAAMQQKVMQYMMIFMGVMFFKVASGLCLYFIASSLWGIAERKLLPRSTPPKNAPAAPVLERVGPRSPANGSNGSRTSKKKNRDRR
ncbi:MAG TPA: YidC/Oxa1 family insertase periplasmic-domain containing protein [Pirellulales bacterium]|nr:YidC/Oxa1 family insertase periplasmic-domain containing protein [Pirellulales bacterium]